jgi:hypothetical protein
MNSAAITWTCDDIDDAELLDQIPAELASILIRTNGFIVHHGMLHIRGAVKSPRWHSLREAWRGNRSFRTLYPDLLSSDVPFGQDLFGDQFILRDGRVLVLQAETGELKEKEASLSRFLERVEDDPVQYLNASLSVRLTPGQLVFAFPPFFVDQSKSQLKACPADEVVELHADIAQQIKELPNGASVEFVFPERKGETRPPSE